MITLQSTAIIHTEWGLTIAGTRITIYDIMDYLTEQYPPKLIQDLFKLTDEQINAALSYIEANREQVETEYQQVLQEAAEIRQYWEDRNRERIAYIKTLPPKPGMETMRAKLQAWKEQLGMTP